MTPDKFLILPDKFLILFALISAFAVGTMVGLNERGNLELTGYIKK